MEAVEDRAELNCSSMSLLWKNQGMLLLLLTNKLSTVRQPPSQAPTNTHTLQWRLTLHFTQAMTWEPQKEKVRTGKWSSKTDEQIVKQILCKVHTR